MSEFYKLINHIATIESQTVVTFSLLAILFFFVGVLFATKDNQ